MSISRSIFAIILLFTGLFVHGCKNNNVNPAQPPAEIPQAKSTQVRDFVWQEDGRYAYAMFRPADWLSFENNNRTYLPSNVTNPAQLSILALNLHIFADNGMDQLYVEPWDLYQQNPNLRDWTRELEKTWETNRETNPVILVESGDNYRVYAFPSQGYLRLTAYIVDQDQPLLVVLDTTGDLADLSNLQESGILEDYLTMVSSARAIPYQPFKLNPAIK